MADCYRQAVALRRKKEGMLAGGFLSRGATLELTRQIPRQIGNVHQPGFHVLPETSGILPRRS